MLQKARELDAFDQQNHGAVPQYSDRNQSRDKNGFHGANSVKVTSYEEEALRTMKAFWLPSATPEAPVKTEAPSTSTICPEGKEKLKMKSLFPIYLTEDNSEKKSSALDKTYICPSCKVTLTNTLSLVALSSCGHVFCKKCADKFMAVDKVCLVCSKACKGRNLVNLEKGGTGFAGHGDNLLATDFKHLDARAMEETETEDFGANDTIGGEFGGVFRMWEGEVLDCFHERRIAIESLCCPCYRFGKNMRRAGFGYCFLQGTVYCILALSALLNFIASIITKRHCFLYLAVAFTISIGMYLGFFRTQMRKKFNIRGSDSSLDDCVYHISAPAVHYVRPGHGSIQAGFGLRQEMNRYRTNWPCCQLGFSKLEKRNCIMSAHYSHSHKEMALKKGKWSPKEDQKLVSYISRYGIWNWNEMPKAAGLPRTGKSCRLRWMNYLRPFIKHGNFSKEEEETIVKLHEMMGNRFFFSLLLHMLLAETYAHIHGFSKKAISIILNLAAKLPGRTDNDIKNYWNSNLRKRSRSTASATKLDRLQTCGVQPKTKKHLSKGTVPKAMDAESSKRSQFHQVLTGIRSGDIDVSGELQFYSLCGQQFPLEGFHIVEDNKANKYPIWHEEPVHSYNCHDDLFKYPAFWSDEYQVTEENNSGLSELSGGVIQNLCEHPRPLMEDLYTANDKREVEGRAHPFEDCPPWYDGNQISGEVQFLWDYQV
ncbi:hypothetical protein GH714_001325 [Hevea brasiliensis]|uniref:RING-type domain-containing protein n=1 Tax=Hevea brasiliensis TaxID=3981 RepID=A0A6A6LX02_HEVBR|nr:hypothetical protein GH714_001325 [Hevea brasiliensis]